MQVMHQEKEENLENKLFTVYNKPDETAHHCSAQSLYLRIPP